MSEFFDPKSETMGRDELRQLQFERLQTTLSRVYETVPFHRERWQAMKLSPADVRSLDDLVKLPLTSKSDFKSAYPYGLMAVPLEKVVRIHSSSGTTANPTVVGYSRKDLDTWSELCARVAVAGGARSDDIAQIVFGYGLTTGALGMHAGLERVGVTVIPASTGNTQRQLHMMRDFKTTILVGTPSYAMYIAEVAPELGYDLKGFTLRIGLFGSEPWTVQLRDELERRTGISAYDNYGLSEVMGPGVSFECRRKDGLHINEDHFLCEVVDPTTGEPLSDGEEGELVFTSLTKEALPVIRYRTGDLASISRTPCECGRVFARHSKVFARADDMLIVRGMNVYPSQVEAVLMGIKNVEPHYHIVLYREGPLDQIEVQVEVRPAFYDEAAQNRAEFQRHVEECLRHELGIRPHVRLVEPKTITRHTGKAQRVTDNRSLVPGKT